MQILAIADEESIVGGLSVRSPDLLISLGDMFDGAISRAVAHYQPRKTFAVRGNHDPNAVFPADVTDLHLSVQEFDGIRFGGFAGCWRYKPRGHHLFDQHEVEHLMTAFPPVDVFVAHNSPFGIHQRDDEVHQGFHAFVHYIHRARPRYFLHGHQHVNQTTVVGETEVIGVYGECLIDMGQLD